MTSASEIGTVARVDAAEIERLRAWQGRSETLHGIASAVPVRGLAATLDIADLAAEAGTELPPLWHWLYFLPQTPRSQVGVDGHPQRGGFLPPVPLPRRMWAGGRLQWLAPLHVGDAVERSSRILSVTHKAGRSGDLVFVTVLHELAVAGRPVLREEQDIVYRAMAQLGEVPPAPQAAPEAGAWSREIVPDPVLLFRYSALTFNGHRIHYDRSYAVEREGYPALVVHGPLIATLLADLVRRHRPDASFASFSFRAQRPLFDDHPFHVCGEPSPDGLGARLWARDHEGWLAMQAEVRFQPQMP